MPGVTLQRSRHIVKRSWWRRDEDNILDNLI